MALFHQQPLQNPIQQQSLTGNPVFIKLLPMLHEQHGHIKEFYHGDPYENRTRVTAVKGDYFDFKYVWFK